MIVGIASGPENPMQEVRYTLDTRHIDENGKCVVAKEVVSTLFPYFLPYILLHF